MKLGWFFIKNEMSCDLQIQSLGHCLGCTLRQQAQNLGGSTSLPLMSAIGQLTGSLLAPLLTPQAFPRQRTRQSLWLLKFTETAAWSLFF